MVYITGDTHADIDIHKLTTGNFVEQKQLTKDDYVIILGDFGFVWDGSNRDLWWQRWLHNKPWTTLFIDGNHDNHPMIWAYPEKEMFGSTVREINDSIFYLQRGEIYNIDGYNFLTLGGAESIDRFYRTPEVSWWDTESIRNSDITHARHNVNALIQSGGKLDFVLTHCAPYFVEKHIGDYIMHTQSSLLLGDLAYTLPTFSAWFFGHYHVDREYTGCSQWCPAPFYAVYNNIIDLSNWF